MANNTNTRKRRRIEDSDDEIVEIDKPTVVQQVQEADVSRYWPTSHGVYMYSDPTFDRLISSKDAYMLIYAKISTTNLQTDLTPTVPARVMDVIKGLNSGHDTALKKYNTQ